MFEFKKDFDAMETNDWNIYVVVDLEVELNCVLDEYYLRK